MITHEDEQLILSILLNRDPDRLLMLKTVGIYEHNGRVIYLLEELKTLWRLYYDSILEAGLTDDFWKRASKHMSEMPLGLRVDYWASMWRVFDFNTSNARDFDALKLLHKHCGHLVLEAHGVHFDPAETK